MSPVVQAAQLFDLTSEVAFVTGASSGLGVRFAEVLAGHGAKVVLAARRLERIKTLAARLENAKAVAFDVTKPENYAAAFDAAEQDFGPVTLLVNNAGVASGGRFTDTSAEEWRRVQDTNVDAVWHLSQFFAKRLIAAKRGGNIINLASVAGFRVSETPASYAVSKAAAVQITRALALELARHDIRVNAIAPGFITSEMTADFLAGDKGQAMIRRNPQRRVGEASDLDGAVLLLASKRASGFMTGSIITVDGGHLLT